MNQSGFNSVLSEALKKDLLFAVYRLPSDQISNLIIQLNESISEPDQDSFMRSGFVFRGFEKPGCFINADLFLSSDQNAEVDLPKVTYNKSWKPSDSVEIDKEDYLTTIRNCVKKMKHSSLEKVVISRMIKEKFDDSPVDAFNALTELYPDALAYMVHLPGNYTWIGASPERLLSQENHTFKTMALAGTRTKNGSDWTEKEYREQSVVEDFISEILNTSEVKHSKSSVFEKELSSGLKHLCTEFSMKSDSQILYKIVNLLHPTPAVCGLPVNEARIVIKKEERHDRGFYTGYLGPVNLQNKSDLFVNLRCGSIFGKEFRIFVGGGITQDSNPEAEWNETMEKAKTLQALLNKNSSVKSRMNEH